MAPGLDVDHSKIPIFRRILVTSFFLSCLSQQNLKYKRLPAAFTIQPFLEPSLSVKKRKNKLSIYRLRVLVGKQSFRLLILMITEKGVCRKSGNV